MSIYAGRFAGRTAIITGGASGLGKLAATRIVAEGGKVALWDLNPDALAAARQEVGATHVVALDVSDQAAVAAAAKETAAALGRVDILICSAGITGATATVWEYPVDSWQRVVDINLNGLFYCNREVVPFMLENGYGRIVNVASVAGKEGNPNASAYSATKAAVIGLTKSLGKELADTGVRVNCVTPAAVKTAIFDQMTPEHIAFMLSKI
ncbi:MAG TPA: SDR family NAD(P)-dependent oxidoreductase, partial [Sphingobium sp.]